MPRGFQPPKVDMGQFKKQNTSKNTEGKNQHPHCPSVENDELYNALWEIHRTGETNKTSIKQISKQKYNLNLSESTIIRRKAAYGIKGSGATTKSMPEIEKRQLIFDQMARDPSKGQGPRTIKEGLAFEQGVHLTPDFIRDTMKAQDLLQRCREQRLVEQDQSKDC